MQLYNKKVSIIVPVYNVEKYLNVCMEGLINQTYKDIEIILINDGSTDSSEEICNILSKKDSRIKVYNQKNRGVSFARNLGLEKAIGEYICFVDPDDYVEYNMIEILVDFAEKSNKDLVICGYYFEHRYLDKDKNIKFSRYAIKCEEKNYKNKSEIKEDLVKLWDNALMYNIWNKLYKSEIIKSNGIRFIEYSMGEDLEFNKNYLTFCNNIYVTSKCLYHYVREREGAATQKYVKGWFDIRFKEHISLIKFFEEYGINSPEVNEYLARRYVERVLGCIENEFNRKNEKSIKEKFEEINKILNNNEVNKAVKIMKPKSKKVKVLLIPIKRKSKYVTYFMGYSLAFSRKHFNRLFFHLKHQR